MSKKNSLIGNINRGKKSGASRSKKESTVTLGLLAKRHIV
jgi:hypothetical protein